MSFPPHASYKNSGVEWVGERPAHWQLKRFKTVFHERDHRSEDGSEELLSVSAYTGVTPRRELLEQDDFISRAESLEGYKRCEPDDLIMNIMLAWNRGLGFARQAGIVSPAYSVFDVIDESNPRFLDYLVRSNELIGYFKAFSSGVIDSRLRIYPERFLSLYCSLPPVDEQQAIADFLDRETAKIDALVEAQQRLIALLKEKRQAVISHAVTKGLAPSAPLKPSGLEWLGDVPRHWEVKPLAYVCSEIGSGTTPSQAEGFYGGDVNWVTTSELREGPIAVTASTVTDRAVYELSALKVYPAGTLLLAMYGATVGRLGWLLSPACTNQACCALVPKPGSSMQYYADVLSSAQPELKLLAAGGGQPNLSQEKVRSFRVPCPPAYEQREISEFLSVQRGNSESLAREADCAIALLTERRAALISAAITGKIDVHSQVSQRQPAEAA